LKHKTLMLVWWAVVLGLLVCAIAAKADIENLKDYPHPIICKPFVKTDTGVTVAEQDKWVIVTWAELDEMTEDTLIFKTRNGDFYIPAAGYICSQ